jgi:hypothetical protein
MIPIPHEMAAFGMLSLYLPVGNHFTVSRISETGVLWCRFRDQNGNSALGVFRGVFARNRLSCFRYWLVGL